MSNSDIVNHDLLHTGKPPHETAVIQGIDFIRELDGIWRYADSGIPVPGARDVTLTERFQPKLIVDKDQKIERVIVSGHDIASAPELLGWCTAEGRSVVEGDELIEVMVPFKRWKEHDRISGELFSPEHEGSEAEQTVAVAERKFREAEQQLEKAADHRAEVLRRHAPEMTRQEARRITGLSVGRIQQLIRDDRLSDEELVVLGLFAEGVINSFAHFQNLAAASDLPRIDEQTLRRIIRNLEGRDLIERKGEGVGLTRDGAEVLARAMKERGQDGSE